MQITKIIEAAQVQRGILPQTFICGCCKGEMDRDEHMAVANGGMGDERQEVMTERYGSNVCFECADNFDPETECDDCGHEHCSCDDAYDGFVADRMDIAAE